MGGVVRYEDILAEDWGWAFRVAQSMPTQPFWRYTQVDNVLFSSEELKSMALEFMVKKSKSSGLFRSYITGRLYSPLVKSLIREVHHIARITFRDTNRDWYERVRCEISSSVYQSGTSGLSAVLVEVLSEKALESLGALHKSVASGSEITPSQYALAHKTFERLAIRKMLYELRYIKESENNL